MKGEWYNIDCLYAEPEHLSKFYLSAYLDSIKGFGWSIFLVRGNFPKECPISSSEASNVFGRWLLPEDAERIIKSCNIVERTPDRTTWVQQQQDHFPQYGAESLSDARGRSLKAAIAASLIDSLPATVAPKAETGASETENKDTVEKKHDDWVASPKFTSRWKGLNREFLWMLLFKNVVYSFWFDRFLSSSGKSFTWFCFLLKTVYCCKPECMNTKFWVYTEI